MFMNVSQKTNSRNSRTTSQKISLLMNVSQQKSRKIVERNLEFPGLSNIPSHLEFDKAKMTGKVNGVVEREWVALQVNELLVIEYYSRQA